MTQPIFADGADTTTGAIADAAVTGDAAGTVSAKLRGINAQLAAMIALGGNDSLNNVPTILLGIYTEIRETRRVLCERTGAFFVDQPENKVI